ncbi:MAG: transcription termination/antitermination NusG family protein [Sedimentisphaerales bacterium]
MKWYVLRVASNKEMHVREVLTQKVEAAGLTDVIGRIEVPVEKVKRVRGNKQTVHKRKLYPGYVFMEMEMAPYADAGYRRGQNDDRGRKARRGAEHQG